MNKLKCADCGPKHCSQGITDESLLPSFCPLVSSTRLIQEVTKKYSKEDIQQFYINSALQEKEAYDEKAAREEGKAIPVKPRIGEIIEFAKKMKFKKLGMAFCSGLSDEASRANSILQKHGFEVCSVVCSCGAVDKTKMGVPPDYKIRDPKKFEAACNPLLQAELLNNAGTSINVLIGLCVGHDMLFTMNSRAPVTTLIVKDRLTGHNPIISLYSRYYRDIV